jgi:hypothetical protein
MKRVSRMCADIERQKVEVSMRGKYILFCAKNGIIIGRYNCAQKYNYVTIRREEARDDGRWASGG